MSVFVGGALHLDVVVDAPHLPGRDETVVGSAVDYRFGGKGGNQAVAAARHGATVAMAGRVGADAFGARLLLELQAAGVDAAQVRRGAGASGMSVAIVEAGGEYGAVIVSGVNLEIDAGDIAVPDGAIALLQNEIPEAVNLAVAAKAAEVWLNAAPARALDPALMARVDVLIVNRDEAARYAGMAVETPGDGIAAARALKAPTVIVTLGGDGLILARDGRAAHLPAFPAEVVSTHGAGDAFVGALAARRALGEGWEAALRYAQAAAALHVSARDRAGIGAEAVAAFLRRNGFGPDGRV
jgi:ribokinase